MQVNVQGNLILVIAGLAFLFYGIMILMDPMVPTELAGLGVSSGDGFVELAAMYGGLQTGYGLFCLLAAVRKDMHRPGLISLAMLMGGLFVGRLYGTIIGVDSVGFYTWGAMAFEFAVMALSLATLFKKPAPTPASP